MAFGDKNRWWRDPEWLKLRERLIAAGGERCQSCRNPATPGNSLTIHHGYYRPGTPHWAHEQNTLWVLCWECHERVQKVLTEIHLMIGLMHPDKYGDLQKRMPDAVSLAEFGITTDEVEEILAEDRAERSTQYSDYRIAISGCNDLGPSRASEMEIAAQARFPGIEVVVRSEENTPDCGSDVDGPDPEILRTITAWAQKWLE